MNKHIAFLLGSGFSAPAGLPTSSNLNHFITSYINNYVKWSFQEGNGGVLQGFILNKVLEDYNEYEGFSYEQYFDLLVSEKKQELNQDRLLSFIEKGMYEFFWKCKKENDLVTESSANKISDMFEYIVDTCSNYSEEVEKIEEMYQHLIAIKILGDSKNGKLEKFNPCYDGFFKIVICYLDQGFFIDIYTLNHDLFLESLFELKGLQDNVSNGFGKDVQKINNKEYRTFSVKNYDNKIRLYKLHGSIDMYELSCGDHQDLEYIQIIDGYSDKNAFLIDVEGEKYGSLNPLFLTGKLSKEKQYENEPYKSLFAEFEKNIGKAEKLIVIGYSGNDMIVNDKVYKNYSNWKDAYIVDHHASNHPCVTNKGAMPINKGIEAFSIDNLKVV